ncbi:predicted protein [Chaetomium globosum CBS 148.51]|uniref:Uncharacterized protein n=1 Tax=Chaetomium globosum (strain ATCC 6205 / CBS 148.51 / DSM 1962 / NBRC 6347 / NRRL 1970) TaxID=306901 RepID=Q2HF46_CHAGB|nr:uncharacterized protein CHGG_01158 [Chaetomium globosum CBS 148.51]EAQ92923.1 predicted protein [Chaetomium globosum CBS 148.51]
MSSSHWRHADTGVDTTGSSVHGRRAMLGSGAGLWQRASCGRRPTPFGLIWPCVVKTQFTRQ